MLSFITISFLKLLSFLPLSVLYCISYPLSCLGSILFTKDKEIISLHSEKILKSPLSTQKIYQNLVLNLFDIIKTRTVIKKSNFRDLENFKNKLSDKSAILISAHIGNWEMIPSLCKDQGIEIYSAAKRHNKKKYQNVIDYLRAKSNSKAIYKNDPNSNREIIKRVKEKSIVASVIDQDTEVTSIDSNFFNKKCVSPTSLINISLKKEIPCYAIFLIRNKLFDYQLYIKEITIIGNKPKDVTDQYNTFLESVIKKHPNQWVWFHKRWRTQNGRKLRTVDYIKWLKSL